MGDETAAYGAVIMIFGVMIIAATLAKRHPKPAVQNVQQQSGRYFRDASGNVVCKLSECAGSSGIVYVVEGRNIMSSGGVKTFTLKDMTGYSEISQELYQALIQIHPPQKTEKQPDQQQQQQQSQHQQIIRQSQDSRHQQFRQSGGNNGNGNGARIVDWHDTRNGYSE